jgi:CRP-like cAMP-binding protein
MFKPLFDYIEQKSGLAITPDEKSLITTKFEFRRLRRRQYLLQEGDICKQMGFVLNGAARMFSVDYKGHEHTLRLGIEGWWLGDYESYTLQVPTKFFVEALEDTNLLVASRESMQELAAAVPAIAEMIRAVDKRTVIATQQRIHAAISLTAEERFEALGKSHPEFLQRFPQNMIASYLGITAETLSRVRKKMVYR